VKPIPNISIRTSIGLELLLDVDNENPAINLHKHQLSADNIVSIFQQYQFLFFFHQIYSLSFHPLIWNHLSVEKEFDYLSVDVDSIDLWLLKAILQEYSPRVIQAEFNPAFPYDCTLTVQPEWLRWQLDLAYGACLGAFRIVGEEFGYSIVHVLRSNDVFMIRNELLEKVWIPPFLTWESQGNKQIHAAASSISISRFIDYSTYRLTKGDLEKSREVAKAYYLAINHFYCNLVNL